MNRILSFQLPPGGPLPRVSRMLHMHSCASTDVRPSRDYEFHFLSAGEMTFVIAGRDVVAHEGDILFFSPGDSYGIRASANGKSSIFHCHFQLGEIRHRSIEAGFSEWAQGILLMAASDARMARGLHLPDRLKASDKTAILDCCTRLINEQREEGPAHAIAAEAHLLLLLRIVSSQVLQALRLGASKMNLTRSQVHLKKAVTFITSELSSQIGLHEVAQNLRLNPSYLSRIFKTQTGMSIGSYILMKRLAIAKQRMLESHLNIKEIAASVGFPDALYFSRQFRKQEGMSPTEFISWHS